MGRFAGLVFVTSFALLAAASDSAADMRRWNQLLGGPNIPIRALAADPQDPSVLYAAISNGAIAFDPGANVPEQGAGVWKSTDGGAGWSVFSLGLTNLNAVAIAIDPTATATVFAATDGGGIFKSTTGGALWSASNNGLPADGEVYSLAMDPSTPTTLYAGFEHHGVYKTVDGGASWSAASTGLGATEASLEIWSLAIDPQTPSTLYAGTRDRLFKSTNAAASWTQTGAMQWLDENGQGHASSWIYAVAVHPTASQTIYAGTLDAGGVFRSDNGGTSWAEANAGINALAGYSYITSLLIDPNDPDTLYTGTQDRGVFTTTNGGTRWVPENAGITRPGVYALAFDGTATPLLYAGTSIGGVHRLDNEPLALDHFRCFRARGPRVPLAPAVLVDDVESRTTSIGKPTSFCEPVSFDGSPVADPATYLTCYAISRSDFAGPSRVGFDDQLSSTVVSKLKPARVCLATERQGTSSALTIGPFKEYRVRKTDSGMFALTLEGSLGSQAAKFFRHASFMTPVDVDSAGVGDPDAHLVCEELRYHDRGFSIPEPQTTRQELAIHNALGDQTISIDEAQTLCLAALRTFVLP